MNEAPQRLLDDPKLPRGLRRGLEALEAQTVDYDVVGEAARFDASTTPSAGAQAGSAAG